MKFIEHCICFEDSLLTKCGIQWEDIPKDWRIKKCGYHRTLKRHVYVLEKYIGKDNQGVEGFIFDLSIPEKGKLPKRIRNIGETHIIILEPKYSFRLKKEIASKFFGTPSILARRYGAMRGLEKESHATTSTLRLDNRGGKIRSSRPCSDIHPTKVRKKGL